MMRRIVASSLRFRFIAVALAGGLLVFGSQQVRDMPVDVFPEFAPPRVEIQTASLGLSSAEIEELVTVPLEQVLQGVPGLDVMRSKSVPQLSSILLIFEPGTDLIAARQLIGERLATVTPTLPSWSTPPVMLQPLSSTSRTMKIGVSSARYDVTELSLLARWKIRPRLMQVSGVANVAIWGQRNEQLHVLVDPARLAAHGITLQQLMTATGDAFDAGLLKFTTGASVGTGGYVETPNQRLAIQHVQPIESVEELRQVVVAEVDGRILRVGDVADVEINHQPLIGDAVINDGEGLLLIVEKFPWANTLEVTHGVEEALTALAPALPDVDVDSAIFRPATFIEEAIGNLSTALLLGCLLVVLVLVLFLYDWRTALISVVAIPLSLMAAAVVLYLNETTLNTMVLAGFVIAVGVVVDDAIIDVENIVRRLRQARREGRPVSTRQVILDASLEVRSAIVYATLIDVAALIPVFLIGGLSGAFFQPLAIAYGLAVLASMVVALTVTPAMAYILLRNAPIERRESPLVGLLQRGYERLLVAIIHRRRAAWASAGAVVLAGAVVVPGLGQSLLPDFKERDFLMHWLATPSASHPEMVRITKQASIELRQVPGVLNFGAHIGQAEAADEVVGMYFGENWISVDPAVDYEDTVASVQAVVDGYPGVQRDVQTYLKERIREVLTGSSEAITIRIFGPELDVLREKADELHEALETVPGLIDLHVQLQTDIPQIDVEVDLAAAERYGLKPGDVRRAASALMASEEVNDTYHDGKIFDVRIYGTPEVRSSVDSVMAMLLDTPTGQQVRLDEVADVSIRPTPNVITREGVSRRIDVGANVRDRDLGAVIRDVEAAIGSVDWPLGYHPELLGEHAERQAASDRLMLFAIAAAIAILLLLQAAFGSTRLALVSFVALPSALVGGLLAAWLGGGVISLGSMVGFFTVLGIAARNGIMLINHYQHLQREEGEAWGLGLIVRGARERLSPILMTALATGLALVPLVVAGDLPGHEIEHPMAIVILGGLVTSTLLNLFLMPVLYQRFGRPTAAKATVAEAG
jgi:CzcA family heavy metal efflux pump